MYLKTIEIQGFKSFANKLVFEFHNGITGIVGPNGSGKSNVADAVRWVLGEQRIKQLRGASMQDVIFSGTELRKPQGFAYVAITLDNSDHQLAIEYDEVTVSRRLYRSGESEYRINGSACRLKDVNELFYDTGIGKEGYSIIGQGQIDKILSGKPEERRELFDEAAGIVKYKRRKAIAQKKLEDEQANLVRVTDILGELEKQVGPLERQSKAAREYLQLKEQLKICDANSFCMDMVHTRSQMDIADKKKELLSGDIEETKKHGETIRCEYDRLEQELSALEQEMNIGREVQTGAVMKKSSLEGQINVLKEQIHSEQTNQEHLRNRRQTIAEDLKMRKLSASEYQAQAETLADEVRRVGAVKEKTAAGLLTIEQQIAQLEREIEGANAEIIDALNETASLNAKEQRYVTMLEQVNLRRSEVSQKLLRFKSDESVQDERIKTEHTALEALLENMRSRQTAVKKNEDEQAAAEKEIRRLTKGLSDMQQSYHTAHTRLESLRNLAERYDGYGNSIRRVMDVRDRVHGIHGVVADIITTKQEYETAIETALGGSIQNIVTDSEITAKHLIEYLKKNKYGRATFLPLTAMKGGSGFTRPEALKENGVLGLASQLVEAKDEYRDLVNNLLGRVVVTDTIDHAIALAGKYRHSFRIVTLEGELLSVGGSMSGGAFKNSSNLLGRKREIEELEESCQKALERTEKLQQELTFQEKQLRDRKEEAGRLHGELQAMALKENTIRMSLSQLENKKQEIAESSMDLVREHSQLEEQIKEIGDSRNTLADDSRRLEEKSREARARSEEKTISLEEMRRQKEQISSEAGEIQVEEAGLKQKLDFVNENIERIQKEIEHIQEEMLSLNQGRGDSERLIEEKQEEIARLEQEIREALESAESLEESLKAGMQKKETLSARQKSLFQAREEISARLSDLDKDLFRVQSQIEKLEEHIEAAASYLWNEYELTPSQAEELKRDTWAGIGDVKREIDELKSRIKALGSINVNAIEDYKELSERYEFMKTQHGDLVNAQAELEKIILELDTGMRRQFQEKFGEIRAEFDRVFKELFGGGRGTLELLEDEDILEAGIQIIAQPPGKKLQNMMQLSGGEKALTAISLLFAIQNLKPSPFCLLDEIEAALDDSNVDRFAGYLHKLTKNTQFIVITHRRGTMMSADRLYGITMQEKGVSTLVSVNLIEDSLTD